MYRRREQEPLAVVAGVGHAAFAQKRASVWGRRAKRDQQRLVIGRAIDGGTLCRGSRERVQALGAEPREPPTRRLGAWPVASRPRALETLCPVVILASPTFLRPGARMPNLQGAAATHWATKPQLVANATRKAANCAQNLRAKYALNSVLSATFRRGRRVSRKSWCPQFESGSRHGERADVRLAANHLIAVGERCPSVGGVGQLAHPRSTLHRVTRSAGVNGGGVSAARR